MSGGLKPKPGLGGWGWVDEAGLMGLDD